MEENGQSPSVKKPTTAKLVLRDRPIATSQLQLKVKKTMSIYKWHSMCLRMISLAEK